MILRSKFINAGPHANLKEFRKFRRNWTLIAFALISEWPLAISSCHLQQIASVKWSMLWRLANSNVRTGAFYWIWRDKSWVILRKNDSEDDCIIYLRFWAPMPILLEASKDVRLQNNQKMGLQHCQGMIHQQMCSQHALEYLLKMVEFSYGCTLES